ncbi:30S ribosomal protein S1 [Nitzschia inconspicua]|uniref:30S ribosomal protein S1 n=1 Tax=Nitzschia inconspicua TaxID=303405 RepID=A0A9K3KPQ0_9STRA|nr:30S ribosomal protein S1 [Nitzschia inconspicua]
MMEEEHSFPRGGNHHRRVVEPVKEDVVDDKRSRKKKRKSTEETDTPTAASIKTDFLFGTKSKRSDEKSSSSKRRKKVDSTVAAEEIGKQSLLPLGGGGVVMTAKRLHHKNGSSKDTTTTKVATPIIEALSFSKLAKGTKLLACVKQIQDEYAIVSLPNLLTAYILPQDPYPLRHTLAVGQTLAVAIQKVATEQVKGGVSRRRIQVTPLPQAINPRNLLVGDDSQFEASALSSAANRLSRSSIPVRGQILSIEDHGCVVDLGFGVRGFVKFDDMHEGCQNYVILEDDNEGESEEEYSEDEKVSPLILQKGRLYDFLVLPLSTSSSKSETATVFPLSLPSISKFASQAVSNLSGTSSDKKRHHNNKALATTPLPLSSLTPGWLVQVKVEALATNGLCVSFFGNVFRGAMEINHLGATLIPSIKDGGSSDGGWKILAASMFQKHQSFLARILAVDVPTKLVRLSIAPHVLNLGHVTGITSPLSGFPSVGSIVQDCTVVKLDPGIGALLALPSQYNYSDHDKALMSKTIAKSSELFRDENFHEACCVRKVYVHISKAFDEAEEEEGKDSAMFGKFQKEFAPSTKHNVRILNTGHWIEGVATGACAPSILEAHVLSHEDVVAGKVYKQVPVSGHMPGGSIMVQLGGNSKKNKMKKRDAANVISGLIPPLQLFDSTSSGSSEYRKRIFQAKYAIDSKIDVRVLWVDPLRKKCLVTAKKTLVQAPNDQIITSYSDLKVGQVAVGFISRIEDDSLYVTFCNKVYGRVTARSLATELGVEDIKENYSVGDVVTCRVVTLKHAFSKKGQSLVSEKVDTEEDDENTNMQKSACREYWELILSLKANAKEGSQPLLEGDDIDIEHPKQIRLRPGAILPKKAMKIVKLVDGQAKKSGGYTPGYAVVLIKSKYLVDEIHSGPDNMTETIECKLPYDQLMDCYDPLDVQSASSMNEMAARHLKVGKKINQKGIVMVDPKKSNVEYSSGLGRMATVSLRKQMILAKERQDDGIIPKDKNLPFVPSPTSELFVGALVVGFVTQLDPRFGGFIRFLGGMTGLITKKQGGLRLPLFNTVVARVKVIDDNFKPHRILLELDSEQNRPTSVDAMEDSIDVGDELSQVTVLDIDFFQATLRVTGRKSKKVNFIMHCTSKETEPLTVKCRKKALKQVKDRQITKSHPFYGLKKGYTFERVTVVGKKRRKDRIDVFVTDKSTFSELAMDGGSSPQFVESISQLEVGTKTHAVVVSYATANKGVIVQVGPTVRGFIPGLELSSDLHVLNDLPSNLPLGAVLECLVLDREQWYKNRISCPLPLFYRNQVKKSLDKEGVDHNSLFLSVLECETKASKISSIPSEGDLVIGRINRSLPQIHAPSLMVELRGGFVGRCCITELDEPDEWSNMPLGNKRIAVLENNEKDDTEGDSSINPQLGDNKNADKESQRDRIYRNGDYVECRVLGLDLVTNQVDVSLRPSRLQGDVDDDPEPQAGDVVQGFVVTTNKKGCFVRVSRTVEGRSTIKEICDGFLPNPEAAFPAGRLVVGKVKSLRTVEKRGDATKDTVHLQVDLDMRESVLLQEHENRLGFEHIAVGDKHKATVQRLEDYGVFVRIDNSNVSGLAHVSECSDNFVKNLSALYNPGDPVKVLVIKKDEDQKKIGFSMKASHFEGDDDSSESSVDSDIEMGSDEEDADMKDTHMLEDKSDDDKADDDIESDDENFATKLAARINGDNDENDSPDEGDETDASNRDSDSFVDEDYDMKTDVLDTDVGFTWGANAFDKTQSIGSNKDFVSSDDSDSESDSEDDQDDANGPSKSQKSRKRQAKKRREEQEIFRREIALADGTADEHPETAGDFERLLAGEPNNSELWIRYMAFHLSLADIPAARKVADKALDRIEFRLEREKLNVWSALLQLEHKYGSEETFQAAIERACKQNNSKQVYLRACEILEKDLEFKSNERNALSRVDDLFATMCRKHKSKKKTWLAHMEYLLKHSRHQDAHAVMKRAMMSLAPYKHAETMCKFAQMEFELGSTERGRTLFDGLLLKYPKRLDMFFVYLDKEIKYGNIEHARSMLEKKVEERKLSDKKMKSLFKKWYKMEEENGTLETQEHVKDAARQYVSSVSRH